MASDLSEAIKQLVQDKGISEDLVLKTIEGFIQAAFKRKYGNSDNAVVRFTEGNTGLEVFARKIIVDDVIDEALEIDIDEAKLLDPEAEIGDEFLIPVDLSEFDRGSVQTAKQTARQSIRDIQKDTLYSEFKDKVGEMIIGYYQREKNGNIFVDLGKVEGILPKKYQSIRETYHQNDRIKALIVEVNKTPAGLQIVLSRTHTELVKAVLELEIPEIYDKTIEIEKIVREPGYRTKIAIYSNRDDVDPVGACVGLKGVRIQGIIRELEGEKVDVLRWDPDPKRFIKNALLPAEVKDVYILDEAKRQALVVVPDSQLSLAIGKQGLNVRLANRLTDWSIDVKTEDQYRAMDISYGSKRAISELFGDAEEEITRIDELPGISAATLATLKENGIELIEDFLAQSPEELEALKGLAGDELDKIKAIIDDNVEVIEEEAAETEPGAEEAAVEETPEPGALEEAASEAIAAAEEPAEESAETATESGEDEAYECPECGARITAEMTACPKCGVGLSFEYEDDTAE
jgi:N utilization substance protein A